MKDESFDRTRNLVTSLVLWSVRGGEGGEGKGGLGGWGFEGRSEFDQCPVSTGPGSVSRRRWRRSNEDGGFPKLREGGFAPVSSHGFIEPRAQRARESRPTPARSFLALFGSLAEDTGETAVALPTATALYAMYQNARVLRGGSRGSRSSGAGAAGESPARPARSRTVTHRTLDVLHSAERPVAFVTRAALRSTDYIPLIRSGPLPSARPLSPFSVRRSPFSPTREPRITHPRYIAFGFMEHRKFSARSLARIGYRSSRRTTLTGETTEIINRLATPTGLTGTIGDWNALSERRFFS